jgi:glucosamine--fructose-6-phosphate aminotransferase (isomerizing)
VLRQNDESSAVVDTLITDLRARNLDVFSVGEANETLPWIGNDDSICDPIAMLLPAYVAIEEAARRRGFDPDNPPSLAKITETL